MAQDPDSPKAIRRRWLSIFFVVHWWAVAAYVLPSTRGAMEPLPDWMEPAVAAVVPRAVRWTSPLTVPYWDLTATRQHWTLFAPNPAGWSQSLLVLPYFPSGDGAGWVADTLTFRGPREQPHPHVLNHRTHRLLWNMGYEVWGESYRSHFAREMCRTLRSEGGSPPAGVEFFADWYPLWAPWVEPWTDESVYRQRLGGWDCEVEGEPGPRPWWAYGLPDPVSTQAWPRVVWPPPGNAGADGGPPGARVPTDSLPDGDGDVPGAEGGIVQ